MPKKLLRDHVRFLVNEVIVLLVFFAVCFLLGLLLAGCSFETEGATDLISYYEASWTCPDGIQRDLPADRVVTLPEGWRCAAGADGGRVFADCENNGTTVRLHCSLDQGISTSVMLLGGCNVQVWCE